MWPIGTDTLQSDFRKKILCVSGQLSKVFDFRKHLSQIRTCSIPESFLLQTERCDWLKAAVLVNNIKWSDENVITLDLYVGIYTFVTRKRGVPCIVKFISNCLKVIIFLEY